HVRKRLLVGVIIELMDRERVDRRIAPENRGSTVAVMYVAIDDHGAADQPVVLQPADGDGDIVDGAETLAVPGEGVMKSAAEIEPDALLQCQACRQNRAAGYQPEGIHHALGIRDFEAQDLVIAERARL